jgi:homocysteine S-methyltransferase
MGRMNSPFLNRLAHGPLLADGRHGTLLFERGVPYERCFDELNLSQPAIVEQIHREYLAAGAELIEDQHLWRQRGTALDSCTG